MTAATARSCQFTGPAPCPAPRAAFLLTFRSADGLEWLEAHCRSHCEARSARVHEQGGTLVDVEVLPEPGPSVAALAAASAAEPGGAS